MRILGLDPGFERLGFAILDLHPFQLANMGVIPNEKDPLLTFNENLNEGIRHIIDQFQRILMIYDPKEVAAEIVPVGKLGSRSETTVAAITVCKTIAFQYGIPWQDYGANTVKECVAHDGQATKAQVRNAILALFPNWNEPHQQEKTRQKKDGIKRPPGIPQDAFDGAAVAVTHAVKNHGQNPL